MYYTTPHKKIKKVTRVDQLFDVYNDDQLWYYIPGFNGYEISNKGFVRSMKMFNQYPYGTLVQCQISKKDGKQYFTISSNNNERIKISADELWNKAMNNPRKICGYPRSTCSIDKYSRNQRCFIKPEKTTGSGHPKPLNREELSYPTFSTRREIVKPIFFF